MTDKDIKDYCKNCDVEPPAMRFKCPECAHNPDKEQIICKYKFRNKEKFDGKPYCTCFCELCEDLPPCDDNCQIYEDYKQLARKEQECEELKNEYWKLEQGNDFLAEKNSRLKGCLAEIKEIAEPFCNACQEFEPEKKGSNCMYCNYSIILRKISEVEK